MASLHIINKLHDFEIKCLMGKFPDFTLDGSSLPEEELKIIESCFSLEKINILLNHFIKNNYGAVLQMKLSEIFKFESTNSSSRNLQIFLKDQLQFVSSKSSKLSIYLAELVVLLVGIASLSEFVRYNWIGPIDESLISVKTLSDFFNEDFLSEQSFEFFKDDDISSNVINLPLLYVSHLFISSVSVGSCVSQNWWLFRSLMSHQRILGERKISLYNRMKSLVSNILEIDCMSNESNITLKIQLLIESAHMHLYYGEVVSAKKYVTNAQTLTGLEIELSGAIGKRTQFQVRSVAQLYVEIKRNASVLSEFSTKIDNNCFPCDVILQDDMLLNKVSFVDNTANLIDNLLVEEQIVLLASCCLMSRSSAFDELLQEEMMAFINCLLSQPKVWCIYIKCLVMRCKAEKNSSRKVERAMMQMQALVDAVQKNTSPFSIRQCMFYSVPIPTHWMLEKELADILLSLGATKSALEIYERLQLWEEIVHCYQKLDRKNKAEEIIRKQLEKAETPILYCLLGDVTNDPDNYLKAWELSNKKSCRAQNSLGYYYYKRKEFERSIPFFMSSIEINHLQQDIWFSIGHAATQTQSYELAAKSYRQVVTLDPDNFEAWNNLANAYIKLNQKFRAWKSLQEALKCNYEEWRMWENFLLVSIDVGAFEDVIKAWHRLLDIKKKHDDAELLNILVKAIANDIADVNGQPASLLRKKALELLGRITSITTTDPVTWELYSLLLSSDISNCTNVDTKERIVTYQQKAIRFALQKQQWEKDFSSCDHVLKSTLRLGEVSKDYIKLLSGTQKMHQKNSFKLMVSGVINIADKNLENYITSDSHEIKYTLQILKDIFAEVLAL